MKKKELLIILLLLILSIPSILPLTHHGFFQTDDGEWMIIRLSAFYQAMHDGQFPVRFLQRLNFSYGYPVAEFLYPGSFYFATLLHVIRFGFVNSIKIVFGLSLFGSVIFTYLWLRKIFSQLASSVGSLFALYMPYHLYDVYKRGSVGEVFALLWVPFIFWQIERKNFFYTSVGISLLIISHNTLAALFLPVIICYMFRPIYLSKNKKQELYYFIYVILSSLGLSAFFWLPVIFELRDTVFSSTTVSQFANYFVTIDQVGYGTLLVLVTIACLFIFKRKLLKNHRLAMLFFIISILAVFLSSSLSAAFWNILPVGFIQFPFRFLSVIIVTIPFLVAFIVSLTRKKQQWITSVLLGIVLAYCALPYISPVAYLDKGEGYYYTNDATTTVQDEYMPVWVKEKPLKSPDQKVVIIKGSGLINNIQPTNNSLIFAVSLKKTSVVQVNTIYWPGWQASLDGKQVPISYNNLMGVMTFSVPSGNHVLKLFFTEDPVRLFSDIISFLTFLWLVFIFIKRNIVTRKRSR